MSDTSASPSFGWEISTRTNGDVLAARARGQGIELVLLSRSAGHVPAQIEGWLAELIGVAVETSHNDPGDRPISALLRHALTGLLFSHAELWHQTPEDPPCSLVFLTTHDRVAFGWAGPAGVEVSVDGQVFEGPIVRVRDPDGREAQAVEVESWQRVAVRLVWRANDAMGSPGAVEVRGEWQGRAAATAETARGRTAPGGLGEWRAPSWLGQQAPWEEPAPAAAPVPEPARLPVAEIPPIEIPAQPLAPVSAAFAPPAPVAPAVPVAPAAPTGSDSLLQMTKEERAAELSADLSTEPAAPADVAPPASAPPASAPPEPAWIEPLAAEPKLEIIRGINPSAPVSAPPGMEIIRGAEPILPDIVPPARPLQPEPEPFASAPARSPADAWNPSAPAASDATSEDDPESGLTAWASRTAEARGRSSPGPSRRLPRARRPAWPSDEESDASPVRRFAPIAIGVLLLFAVGWALGGFSSRSHGEHAGPLARVFSRLGVGPARFEIAVDSYPQGAWIALDGRDLARRTPAVIEAEPGTHQVSLSVANLGHAMYEVRGERNQRVTLDATLWGSLAVTSADNSVAVKVTVDGTPRGLAPVTVDSLAPGVHQVQFWSPGAGSWDRIVEVRVRQAVEVTARPIASPATGVLEVRAILSGDGTKQTVSGVPVWLDGEPRGVTPLKLELPRGPHSVRIAWRGQDPPVQIIDLPGGNQRFANFELGGDLEHPRLKLAAPGRMTAGTPELVSATLEGLSASDVREMWLHVSTGDEQWRRFAMNVIKAPGGAVGTVLFPVAQPDGRRRTRFYVSVSTRSGDELFTEVQSALGPPSANTASTR